MLFTCPADVARDSTRKGRKRRSHVRCIDLHCHVHTPVLDELVRPYREQALEPMQRFTNQATRVASAIQLSNVLGPLTSVDQRLADMDRMGVDIQVISPAPGQFMYWLDPEVGRQTARIVNENLASIVAKHPKRFVALANVPFQAPAYAVEELDYCVRKLGFRGVEIGTSVPGTEISRDRDAFWAKVQELDVMVFLHPNGFSGGERLADHYFQNVVGNPLDTTVAVGHLVFDGVLERFPKLKLVAAHGGGYVSHYPGRMDHAWTARTDTRTQLRRRPSRSLAKVHWDTLVFDADQLDHLVRRWGAKRIVVGTDYPFDMGQYDPRGFVADQRRLSKADREAILSGNAARLLGLKRRR